MHSIVTTFRGAVIKVEVANFCAAMDTLIDQDGVGDNQKLARLMPESINQHEAIKKHVYEANTSFNEVKAHHECLELAGTRWNSQSFAVQVETH